MGIRTLGQAGADDAGLVDAISEGVFWGAMIFLVFLVAGLVVLLVDRRFRDGAGKTNATTVRRLVRVAAGIVVIIIILLIVPLSTTVKTQLLGLFGLALTAVVALSSTTFVSNAMAGWMVRMMGNFREGDFVRVGDQFGRVTERGLFHTEIQTEDRDLATLPNMYLVTNPVKVVRGSGTIVSATVSLGYDAAHTRVETLLIEAATSAELDDPFVHVLDLGDFAVTYRVSGFLREVKQILSVRSRLRKCMLDALHGGGIEIVSPTFMNQRPLESGERVMARSARPGAGEATPPGTSPEDVIFDKAEEAERLESLRQEREEVAARLKEIGEKKSDDEQQHLREEFRVRLERLDKRIERAEERKKST